MNKLKTRMPKLSLRAMLTLLTLASMLTLTGCQTVRVIPSDKAAQRMTAGKPFTPSVNGWFVPDARMLEIMNALDKARIQDSVK